MPSYLVGYIVVVASTQNPLFHCSEEEEKNIESHQNGEGDFLRGLWLCHDGNLQYGL